MSFRLLGYSAKIALPVARRVVSRSCLRRGVSPSIRTLTSTSNAWNQHRQNVSNILSSELKIEQEAFSEQEQLPEALTSFLTKNKFKIIETPGKNEAQITKTNGETKETINVVFDVAQIANLPYDTAINEQTMTQENEEEDFDESFADNFANVNVIVTKDGNSSTLSFELLLNLQEGTFYVDSVTPYKSTKDATDQSAEAQMNRELLYHGPPFSNLDEELQESLELYLENRGINQELASFITSYSEFKENNEYIDWLSKMKSFFN
ncbi:hypothetical protein KAFR_0B01320 [Kazachstania africana CBS 2517]|uniref:Mitochondrial acidic protein MAM33 n=1 Tax=Kazachstania africana (strain ATCC 22294 / BCRC 22015 / CBS 2517 / CECT 1963 / NBRC 1671 / NRRL Y-8276) TaxID=1071382 RepID=H2APY1_KAZAF|nr:hypothetical protein KAFR_0B01320 [Kazachstania africana CBS 2517]CCF56431.1 hypothetical protein KAFR_0B01320 [Kazachstania africana CBS 2517]